MGICFDPAKACPIIKNFECSQEDCGFWDADRAECIFWDTMAGFSKYAADELTVPGSETNYDIDLGDVYKDITIWVDQDCVVRLNGVSEDAIELSATYGRVGTPVYFRGFNARHVYITTTLATNVSVVGNG